MIKLIDLLKEGKQVGILYHYTSYEACIKILQSNKIKSTETENSTIDKSQYSISFTRDKNFHKSFRSTGNLPSCRLVIDGDKLSNKYKINPYVQSGFEKGTSYFEAEENIISDNYFSIPLKDYLISRDMVIDYRDINKEDNFEKHMLKKEQIEVINFCKQNNIKLNLVNKNGISIPNIEKKTFLQKLFNL